MITSTLFSNIQKRIMVGVMAVIMLFGMFAFAGQVQAQTSNNLAAMQAQIVQLTQILNTLLAQLAAMQTTSTQPESEGGFATSEFAVGDTIKTTSNLKVRSGAGISSNWVNNILPYTVGTITGGPRYADGYTWWQVAYNNGTKGWSAEGWFNKLSAFATEEGGGQQNNDFYDLEIKHPDHGDVYEPGDAIRLTWDAVNLEGEYGIVTLEGNNTQRHIKQYVDIGDEAVWVTIPVEDSLGRVSEGTYELQLWVSYIKDGDPRGVSDVVKIKIEDSANDEIDRLIDLVNGLQSKPSCSIRTSSSGYEYGDRIKLIWDSNNASYASFVQDTSGKDSLWLPGDKLSADGYQYIDANVAGNPTVTLKVSAGIGGETALCSVRIPIDQNDSNQSEIDRLIDLVDDLQGQLPNTSDSVTGTYKGYMDGSQFIQTNDISREYAVENCELNADNNPHRTVYCTWNNEVIFTKEAAMKPEADDPPEYNAYACDRANGSIIDHKSACYGVWDYGSSFGSDKDMCGAYSSYELGCVIDAPICASGLAEAVDHFSNSELKKMSSYQLGIIANNLETTSEIVKEEMAGMWEYNCVSE